MENSNGKSVEKERRVGRRAIVIGGGLVGALCVCILARRGYIVTMFEKREDVRKSTTKKGRSINLALSHRGRKALRLIGVEEDVLKNSIPMRGRLLHSELGVTTAVPYDPVHNQCIYSVGRNFLNQTLLSAAEKYPSVELIFTHKLINVEFEKNAVKLQNLENNEVIEATGHFIVGADGAFSNLRSFMQKTVLFDFSQTYIEHGYLELCVSPENGHKLRANHLHIWPRGEFMMIALPNQDHSWTVTLFMPFKIFEVIDTTEKLLDFFQKQFPDALPLIGEKEVEIMFFKHKPCPLVSIKCGRYEISDRFLIIGDAAHAMVPFYGQGMNAGFEDCSLLNEILDETDDNISESIKIFTDRRKKDAHSICDLAMYNYIEMRELVTKPTFRMRRVLDGILGKIMPEMWIPLYNSVCFSDMGYSQCVENRRWQNMVLLVLFFLTSSLIVPVILLSLVF